MNDEIIDYLAKHIDLSEELKRLVLKYIRTRKIKKGAVVLEEGKISNECFFILRGCMKRYYIRDGEEKITAFYTEGQTVTPASYMDRLPSKYYISSVEDTFAIIGDPDSESEIYERHPELESMTRILVEKLMADVSNEHDNWVSNNPEERYLQLLQNRPDLVQRVPQYQLANYLGIKPQSLSRIRKRITIKR